MPDKHGFLKQKEITRQRLVCFKIKGTVPPMEINDIIAFYQATKEEKYINYLLHFLETDINKLSYYWCRKTCISSNRFDELKQVIACTLTQCLEGYDLSKSVPFLAYSKPYIKEEILRYVNISGTSTSAKFYEYKLMRKMGQLISRYENEKVPQTEVLDKLSVDMKITNRSYLVSLYEYLKDYTGIKSIDYPYIGNGQNLHDLLVDHDNNTESIAFRQMLLDDINHIMNTKLTEKQKLVLLDSIGICTTCYKAKRTRKTYGEIAEDYDLFSESAIEKTRKAAVKIIRDELGKLDW